LAEPYRQGRACQACYTQTEIAKAINVSQQSVSDFTKNGNLADSGKISENEDEAEDDKENADFFKGGESAAAKHETDFEPPIYNVWKQQTKTSGSAHFGNSEVHALARCGFYRFRQDCRFR
jgi:hypothetical protein